MHAFDAMSYGSIKASTIIHEGGSIDVSSLTTGGLSDAPSDGEQYARQDGAWVVVEGGSPTTVSATAPSNPEAGDLWFDTETARTFVYTGSEWADAAPDAGFPSAVTSDTAPSSPQDGDLWFRTTDARMYVYYDDGVTAQWVDANPANANARTYIGDTAPSNPVDGSLWWDSSDSNNLYVYYNDGSTAQWVPASITGGGADNVYLERSGTTLSPVSAGDSLDLGTGDLSATKGTFSTGVLFGTDTAAANTLDDYEEGTWTPTIEGSTTAGTCSYVYQNGTYTRIGDIVWVQCRVSWTGHTGTGDIRLKGFPFNGPTTGFYDLTIPSIRTYQLAFGSPGWLQAYLYGDLVVIEEKPADGGDPTGVAIDTAADISLTHTYKVA